MAYFLFDMTGEMIHFNIFRSIFHKNNRDKEMNIWSLYDGWFENYASN